MPEARRLGGGKSLGMQRGSVAQSRQRRRTTTERHAPAATPQPAPTTQPKRNWFSPIAGLAASLALPPCYRTSVSGEGGMANFVMIALLVMAAVLSCACCLRSRSPLARIVATPSICRRRRARHGTTVARNAPSACGASRRQRRAPGRQGQHRRWSATYRPTSTAKIFARVQASIFRLQAANDARNFDDLREFLAPELFAEVKLKSRRSFPAAQQTDVVSLNAEVLF